MSSSEVAQQPKFYRAAASRQRAVAGLGEVVLGGGAARVQRGAGCRHRGARCRCLFQKQVGLASCCVKEMWIPASYHVARVLSIK